MRLLAALLVLLSGCSTKYVAPADGPLATLELPMWDSGGGSVWVGVKGQDGCATMEVASEGRVQSTKLRPDRNTLVMMSRQVGNGGCEVVGEFVPRAAAAYRLDFGVALPVCKAGIQVRQADGSWLPVALTPAYVGKVRITKACDAPSKL